MFNTSCGREATWGWVVELLKADEKQESIFIF